jgi:DNA modification methylase
VDIIFSDVPYALGSSITIRQDGKPDYSKAVDFMNKWEMPDGKFWEEFYKEVFRVLKFGGHCLMYGMDRQNFMFKYYGHLAGFTGKQSLYWFYISSFPKATDLAKGITAKQKTGKGSPQGLREVRQGEDYKPTGQVDYKKGRHFSGEIENDDRETELTPLAQKYSGYKYSVAPLKQVVEEIMVFQKPMKTGSVLHDTLAMENGDDSITCGALDIDGNRVGTEKINVHNAPAGTFAGGEPDRGSDTESYRDHEGRYPAQAFLTNTEDILDRQSGVKISREHNPNTSTKLNKKDTVFETSGFKVRVLGGHNDTGGCSKILHKCEYTQDELDEIQEDTTSMEEKLELLETGIPNCNHNPNNIRNDISYCSRCLYEKSRYDLFNYCPKVSKKERNAGCEEMEEKQGGSYQFRQDGSLDGEIPSRRNSHPTVKPISLNEKILRLFKTPNQQKILIPFAGSGSEVIGAYKAGFEDIQGCEINEEYVKIAEARIKYYENIW